METLKRFVEEYKQIITAMAMGIIVLIICHFVKPVDSALTWLAPWIGWYMLGWCCSKLSVYLWNRRDSR